MNLPESNASTEKQNWSTRNPLIYIKFPQDFFAKEKSIALSAMLFYVNGQFLRMNGELITLKINLQSEFNI